MQGAAVARQAQQALHHRACVIKVCEGFEQRHHAHWPQNTGFLEQQLHGEHIGSGTGHGNHIGAQGRGRRGSDLATGGEYFGGVSLWLEVAGQQRPPAVEFLLQEGDTRVLIPLGVTSQSQVLGDLTQRCGMPGGILTHVQAHQKQAERHCPAQAVKQRTIGDHAHATGVQRFETQVQGLEQVMVMLQHQRRRCLRRLQGAVCPGTGFAQAITQLFEHCPVRFGRIAHLGPQRLAGLLHGQLGGQGIDIAQKQVSGHPARQQQHFAGDRGGDIGVAIAITAHPRGKTDGRGLQRQVQAGSLMQGLVDFAQMMGNGVPERMLDHRKAPLGLIHRRWPGAADLLGVPGFGDQPLQTFADLLAFGGNQVAMILGGQLCGDRIVLLDQRTACHFGGVGGQHQLDTQLAELTRQRIVTVPGRLEPGQEFGQHPRFEWVGLACVAAANQLILFGDVGQVEELVEGPRHR
ncbi:hypothetical protein D3C77_337100 [compost metagenome]